MVAMRDIKSFSDAIAREFEPERIILFGSHARGEAGRDSDVDILVIMPHRGHPVYKAVEIRRRVDCSFALDLLVRSPREIERRLGMNDWFIREIVDQGKVMYGRRDARVGGKSGGRLPKRRAGKKRKEKSKL